MKRLVTCLLLALASAAPALADVKEALESHLLPGYHDFVVATEALEQTARSTCLPADVTPAFHEAFDAWMWVADIRLGPSETGALPIMFWPDTRGFTRRSLARLIADEDPIGLDAQDYAHVSIAARGLMALERLLFDPEFATYADGSYTCQLVGTIAADLATQARDLSAAWEGGFAPVLLSAGAEGNTTFLGDEEVARALLTQMLSGLEFTTDRRLGRPMGTFERQRPTRAEAWRSGRSLRNTLASVNAAHVLARTFADWDLPRTDAALEAVHYAAQAITDPSFQNVTNAQERFHLEALQQAIQHMHDAIDAEIGEQLGIAAGFNAQDGD